MDDFNNIFILELNKYSIIKPLIADDVCTIMVDQQVIAINIDNLRREYGKSGNVNVIIDFVNNIISSFSQNKSLSWSDVCPHIRYSLESSIDQNFIANKITNNLYQVYTYTSIDKSSVIYIEQSSLEKWGVKKEDIVQVAKENMNNITTQTLLNIELVDNIAVGMLSMEETFLKASIILSSTFRDLVYSTHGWPIYAVIPCRDFVYIISEKDIDFLGNLGEIVNREYHNSSYPITQEVFMVSDEGIHAIGTFENS
jgi:hypothetical protein